MQQAPPSRVVELRPPPQGQPTPTDTTSQVRYALLALKSQMVRLGLPGTSLADWQPWSNPCGPPTWTGVTCVSGQVVGLAINPANVPSLAGFPKGASSVSLTLVAPELKTLTALELVGVPLQAPSVLPALPSLTNLRSLNLSNNGLAGQQLLPALSGLQALTSLDVSGNALTGSLPAELSSVTGLAALKLAGNQLVGSVPEAWAALTGLTQLSLQGNAKVGGRCPLSLPSTCPFTFKSVCTGFEGSG